MLLHSDSSNQPQFVLWFNLICVTACCHVLGYDDDNKSLLVSQKSHEKKFGQSPVFVASTFYPEGGVPQSASPSSLLKEAIHVISCGYEDKSEWGKEVSVVFLYP